MLEHYFLQTAVWAMFAFSVAIMLVNSVCMLISPSTWFSLPKWLGLQGVLTFRRYGKGFGALQIRAVGAMITALVLWIAISAIAPYLQGIV